MSESESKVFKPRPKHLLPVVLGLLATGILAYPISLVGAPQAQVTPFVGDNVTSASLNAVVFVFALGASATVMFLLIRRGRMRFIRRLVKGALVLVSFAVAFWYSTSILASVVDLSTNLWTIVSLLLSLAIAAAIGLTIFGKGQTRQLSGVTALGALTGVFLGYSIGPITALVLVGALVGYGFLRTLLILCDGHWNSCWILPRFQGLVEIRDVSRTAILTVVGSCWNVADCCCYRDSSFLDASRSELKR